MQRLAAALEQALVGCVLDQSVLEAIFGLQVGRALELDSRSASASRSMMLQARGTHQFRRRRAAAHRRNRVQEPRQLCATSRAGPSRSRRAARDCCKVGGMKLARRPARRVPQAAGSLPLRTAARRLCARSQPPRSTSLDRACCAAISPTMRATPARSSGDREINDCMVRAQAPRGRRNSRTGRSERRAAALAHPAVGEGA